MKYKKPAVFIVFMLGYYAQYAAMPRLCLNKGHLCEQLINKKGWNFVENKGQVADPKIRYYGHQGGIYLYCNPGNISFIFTKVEKEPEQISEGTGSSVETQCLRLNNTSAIPQSPLSKDTFNASLQRKITTNRADLILLNSNPSAQIIASDQQKYYENFYLSNTGKNGITNVHTYKTITYKNIYPFIDLVLHVREQGMKYEFVVYPEGKVSDIQIQWNGLESIKKLKNSSAAWAGIEYSFALGNTGKSRLFGITESAPYSYVRAEFPHALNTDINGDNLGDRKGRPYKIPSQFILKNNLIGFKIGRYSKTQTLIIDPTLVWGTYFGGSGEDEGNSVAIDGRGNVFITGNTLSRLGIATNGAYQTSSNSGEGVAYLAKFNASGKIQWATYYGDSSAAISAATDGAGNVFITGQTHAKSGIATNGAYQTVYGDHIQGEANADAFLVKFNGKGIRQWGTYYGGPGDNYGSSVATDALGNIYITGGTSSSTGIATSGAYQTHSGNSNTLLTVDAFLAKFDSSGTIQWATYYGYAGSKSGDNYPTSGYGVATDRFGNAYIAGQTGSATDIATSGAYETRFYSSGFDIAQYGFLAKFNSAGAIQWGTYFGDSFSSVNSVMTDASGNIYIAGSTTGDTSLATAGAYQTKNTGGEDAFLAKLSSAGSVLWSTYYGGPSGAVANAVCTDGFGSVYIAGETTSTSGIATNDAYQTGFDGLNNPYITDVFLAKFSSLGSRIWATYFVEDSDRNKEDLCADGSGNVYLIGTTFSDSGMATSGAYQTSYGGDEDAFLAKFRIIANNDAGIAYLPGLPPAVCTGTKPVRVQLQNYGLYTLDSILISWSVNGKQQPSYRWSGNLAPDSSMPVRVGSYDFSSGIYTVKSWTSKPNGAFDSLPGNDTFITTINVNALPPIVIISQSTYSICTGTHIKIGANAQPSYVYAWSSVPVGFSSTLADPVVNPTANTVYDLMVTDTLTGCTNTNSANVSVSILKAPVVNAGSNQSICMGVSAQIGSSAQSGDTYSWASNPAGFVSTMANPVVTPVQATSYSLTVTNTNGCTNFDSVIITINPRPQPVISSPQNICSQTAIQLGGTPTAGYSYQWTSKPTGFNSNISNPIDSPYVSTTYYLKETISATGCADSDSVKITVVPRPDATFSVKNIGGFEYQFTVNNPNYPSLQYQWDFNDPSSTSSDIASGYNVTHVYAQNGNYNAVLTIALPGYCTETDSDLVIVNESFSLNIFPNPFNLQTNIQYLLTSPAHVKISMTDDIGRNIGTLLDRQLAQGEYNTIFDGAAWKTRPAVYFIIFQMDDKVIVKKTVQIDSIYY